MPDAPLFAIRVLSMSWQLLGRRLLVDVELANRSSNEEFFRTTMHGPTGWRVQPAEIEVSVFPGQSGLVTFGASRRGAACPRPRFQVAARVGNDGGVTLETEGEMDVGDGS